MSFKILTAMLPLILRSPLLSFQAPTDNQPEMQIQYAPHSLYQSTQKKNNGAASATENQNDKQLSEPAFGFVDTKIPSKLDSSADPRNCFLTDYLVLTTVGLAQLAGASAAIAKDDKPKDQPVSALASATKNPETAKDIPNLLPKDKRANSQLQFNIKFELAFSQNESYQIRSFVIRPDGLMLLGQAQSSVKIQDQIIDPTPLLGFYQPGIEISNNAKTNLVITTLSGAAEVFSVADNETVVDSITTTSTLILPPHANIKLYMGYDFTKQPE